MNLPISTELEPMEARLRTEVPAGAEWNYEPKWDGFRCLMFRDGAEVELWSKAGKPLGRYFPDVVEVARSIEAERFALDGEIVIPINGALSFDELLLRIHPAASRVEKLAAAHPAVFVAFDLLVDATGRDRTGDLQADRRSALVAFAGRYLDGRPRMLLSPATDDVEKAREWLAGGHPGLDGIVAKRRDLPYQAGNRDGMVKVKRLRTADCVVGGFRWSNQGKRVASLLLGLYHAPGQLDRVGFCSSLNAATRKEADSRLIPLRGGDGFSGKAPGGKSRWRKEGSADWEPVRPEVVVEVRYDHFTSGRFRHGTKFLRWRPDKSPAACTFEQVEEAGASALKMI